MKVRAGQSPPFLRLPPSAVRAQPWTTAEGLLPPLYHDWDPAVTLRASRTLFFDVEETARALQLEPASKVGVGCTWQSSTTRLRGRSPVRVAELKDLTELSVQLEVPGPRVGGTLVLRTLMVTVDPRAASDLAAQDLGDILWEIREKIVLEGYASRFPLAVLDFKNLRGVPTDASWFLSWPTRDYHEPWGASLQLLINSRNREARDAVTTQRDDEAAAVLRRQIKIDIARALITNALRDELFLEQYEVFEDEAVGGVIRGMIEVNWGKNVDPKDLAGHLNDDPARFEASLQALFLK